MDQRTVINKNTHRRITQNSFEVSKDFSDTEERKNKIPQSRVEASMPMARPSQTYIKFNPNRIIVLQKRCEVADVFSC